jgi:RimJ/RimL family protein N-acetyltransferase
MIPSLETERLVLRGPRASDYDVYKDFLADAEASRAYGGPLDADAAWRVLAMDLGHWSLRGYGRWAVVLKATDEMIGCCGLWWPQGWPRSELTWWIIPSARRHGYAFEASEATIRFGYQTLGWSMVETHMQDENDPARRLVEKLGGRIIGRERFPDGFTRNIYVLPQP